MGHSCRNVRGKQTRVFLLIGNHCGVQRRPHSQGGLIPPFSLADVARTSRPNIVQEMHEGFMDQRGDLKDRQKERDDEAADERRQQAAARAIAFR